MKRTAVSLAIALMLSGCAGLNVSWSLTASYNAITQAASVVQHAPAPEKPEPKPVNPGVGL